MKRMGEVIAGYEERNDEGKVILVLNEGCRDLKAGKAIECMWRSRFCTPEYQANLMVFPAPSHGNMIYFFVICLS